ncbi:MAG: CBS domain-containing protein [Flavobacteriaceae bacterium]|jgi:CBS domain-containing protein|nr:CBS domain-containing protein [Flavobacteriaceae bacterium]
MIIAEYLSKEIFPLAENSSIQEAERQIVDFRLTHLPVVKDGKLLGSLNSREIQGLNSNELIKNHWVELEKFSLSGEADLFDAFPIFSEYEANIIPVLDKEEKYIGVLLSEDIIYKVADFPFITEFGAYLTLTTPIQKYSISEIANIVESNNGKILGLMLVGYNENKAVIALKVSIEHLKSIGDAFERYGYRISNKYWEDSKQELLRDRFKQLQKFIEV